MHVMRVSVSSISISIARRAYTHTVILILHTRIARSVMRSAITIRKKVLAISLVAASEAGRAQTIRVYMSGVVGRKR